MRPSLSAALWLAATALFSLPVQSQIETPAEFLGYELGDRFTRHHKVVDYAQSLADGSDRAVWMPYGRTSEYRDLGLLIVDEEQRFGVAQKEALRQLPQLAVVPPALAARHALLLPLPAGP